MDIAALAAAQEGIKVLFGLAKGAASAAVDHQVKDRLIEIQQAVLDVQAKLGDVQAERLELLHEMAELRSQLRELRDAKAALESYELSEMEPGLWLMKTREGHPRPHHACPRCYGEGRVGLMQATDWSGQTHWSCSSCAFLLLTGKPDALPVQRYTSYF